MVEFIEEWGYWIGDKWIMLPKESLVNAGFASPPFDVTRPDGKILHVVARKMVDDAASPGDDVLSASSDMDVGSSINLPT